MFAVFVNFIQGHSCKPVDENEFNEIIWEMASAFHQCSNYQPKISHTDPDSLMKTASELYYISHGHLLNALTILCQGLVDDDGDLILTQKFCRGVSPKN